MLLLLLACTTPDEEPPPVTDDTGSPPPELSEADQDAIAAFERGVKGELRTAMASGVQYAIWRDGEIIYSSSQGTRTPDSDEPILPTTLFEIGSDTKKITAMALLRQVEAGHLTLQTTVAEALPGFTLAASPDWAETTTLQELISHQGGLVDYTPWDDVPDDGELSARAYDRLAPDGWAMMPSGVAFNYANPNFSLAGLAVEKADGRAWADIVEQDIFAPLGLTRTFARESEVEADGDYAVGHGYLATGGTDTMNPLLEPGTYAEGDVPLDVHPDNAFTRPAGMVWSTAEDMARLLAVLVDGDEDILADTDRVAMTTVQVPEYPHMEEQGYGYGVFVLPDGFNDADGWIPTPLWFHGGNTLSYTSTWCALPESRVIITLQSNGYGDYFLDSCVAAAVALGAVPDPVEAPALYDPVASLDAYVGTWYDSHTMGTITITTDGTDLFVEMPDFEALGHRVGSTLTVYGEDVLTGTIDGATYELLFYPDAAREEKHYLVNRSFVAERQPL